MTTPPPSLAPAADAPLWQGRPAARAQLPTYLALLAGALLATVGLVFLARASDAPAGERSLATLLPWLIALAWVIALAAALATYLGSRTIRYTLSEERLRVTTGLLSTTTQELELRRVRDTVVVRPLLLRLLGVGHVTLLSADATTPRVTLQAVPDPEALQTTIRGLVDQHYRQRGGVREIDVL